MGKKKKKEKNQENNNIFLKEYVKYMYNNKSKTARISVRLTRPQARFVEREENGVSELVHPQELGYWESLAAGEGQR